VQVSIPYNHCVEKRETLFVFRRQFPVFKVNLFIQLHKNTEKVQN
jgi:hypothetical protein